MTTVQCDGLTLELLYRSSPREDDHSLWRAEDGRFVISDQSGRTPDRTEDGVLFVDVSRSPLRIDETDAFTLPVTKDGVKYWTITTRRTLERLRSFGCRFAGEEPDGWIVSFADGRGTYSIEKDDESDRFADDDEAADYVANLARRGHKYALEALCLVATQDAAAWEEFLAGYRPD